MEKKVMKENKSRPFSLCKNKIWSKNENPLWLASTMQLYRNIEKFNFPSKLDAERSKQLLNFTSREFLNSPNLNQSILYKGEELTLLEKEFLVEHFLSNQSFHQVAAGEAFVIEESGEFMASLNIRNHLQLELIDTKGELENAWNKLLKIETDLGKTFNYAYSPKYGFLTSDPNQCGTALIVTAFLQLSALVHTEKVDEILEKFVDESLNVSGIQGSPTEIIGDVVAIQNNYTLGVSEENIVASIRTTATKIVVEEHAARNQIRHEQTPHIKDKVSRAYGILIHSYQIEAVEALNAISLLKLGADMNWISGVTVNQLNELFFNCRRAHLLCQFDEKIPQEEISHKRAEFIHKTLKDVKLNI